MKLTSITRYLLIGVLFPLLIQYVMYYRFTPNYQPGIYSESGFRTFYETSVFKYRVLGRSLHLWLYHQLKTNKSIRNIRENKIYDKRLLALDPNADNLFYLTYYIINGLFSVLLALSLLYLFDRKQLFVMNDADKIFTTTILLLVIAVTQFVITPYDVAAYFFEVLTFIVFLKYLRTNNWWLLLATCVLIMAATLIRESAILILCLMGAVYFTVNGYALWWVKKMIPPCISFFIAYFGLRMCVNSNSIQFSENTKLAENLTFRPSALMGIFMAITIFYMILNVASRPDNRKLVRHFFVISLPYVVMVIFVGLLVELRLWVPLIIGTAMLYKLNLNALSKDNRLSKTRDALSAKL